MVAMATMQAHEIAFRTVNKHKIVGISYPRTVMGDEHLIYPETKRHDKGLIF